MLCPSHVHSYLAVRFPVSLLCVNRHCSVRLLCYLHCRGGGGGGWKKAEEEFISGLNARQRRLPGLFHTGWGSPHPPPIDEGPRLQCGALPPQMARTDGYGDVEEIRSSSVYRSFCYLKYSSLHSWNVWRIQSWKKTFILNTLSRWKTLAQEIL